MIDVRNDKQRNGLTNVWVWISANQRRARCRVGVGGGGVNILLTTGGGEFREKIHVIKVAEVL